MKRQTQKPASTLWPRISGGFIALLLFVSPALAEEPSVFLVEEDWELVLNEPDQKINSPQVAFFLYPDANRENVYFQLQMNYAAEDGYSSGGFRVGAFKEENPIDEERSEVRQTLSWDGDRIEWTSAAAVFHGKLMYAVKDGHGLQWGNFGGPEYLVEMDQGEIANLNDYDPGTSVENVDIGFGANRVASVRLKTVRLTYTSGQTKTIQVNRWAKQSNQ